MTVSTQLFWRTFAVGLAIDLCLSYALFRLFLPETEWGWLWAFGGLMVAHLVIGAWSLIGRVADALINGDMLANTVVSDLIRAGVRGHHGTANFDPGDAMAAMADDDSLNVKARIAAAVLAGSYTAGRHGRGLVAGLILDAKLRKAFDRIPKV